RLGIGVNLRHQHSIRAIGGRPAERRQLEYIFHSKFTFACDEPATDKNGNDVQIAPGGLPVAAPPPKQGDVSRASAEGGRPEFGVRDHMVERAARVADVRRRVLVSGICLGALTWALLASPAAHAESLPE